MFLRFNTSIRQIEAELDVSFRTLRERVERFTRALDAPSMQLSGLVEIDELYVSAGMKRRERDDHESRSRGLSTHRLGSFNQDNAPIFTLVDRGSDQGYIVPAKSTDESTVRLLLDDHEEESLTVYTDGLRAHDPLEDDDSYDREYVVHGNGEYVDGDVHVNGCESHASLARRWLSPHRGISKTRLTLYFRALHLRRDIYRKPGDEALKHALDAAL